MVFYWEWYDHIKFLSADDRLKFYEAVFGYAFYGRINLLENPAGAMAFHFAKDQMQRDWEKYEKTTKKNAEISEKRKEAAKKGNEAKRLRKEQREKERKEAENSQNNANANLRHDDNEDEDKYENKNGDKNIDVYGEGENIRVGSAKFRSLPYEQRKPLFIKKLKEIINKEYEEDFGYTHEDEIEKFIDYWTETTPDGGKMRLELQKTWDTEKRFASWLGKPFASP